MRYLFRLWRRWQRHVDLTVLWPSLKQTATACHLTLDDARGAFLMHMLADPAWSRDYEPDTLREMSRQLT